MKVLVINCGSSSLKYQLFDMEADVALAKGLVERIGEMWKAGYTYEANGVAVSGEVRAPDHEAALQHMVERLTDPAHGAVESLGEIDAVGHRVVHGGEAFAEAVEITEEVIAAVEQLAPLAPLHNPPNLIGIRAARRILSNVPHVAVFDTAFHETMPPHAYHYGIPYEFYEKYHVRRYGFHGTSHVFVARRAAEMLGKPVSEFSGITCHLGNGCSITAIRNGRSVDTSMGLTPLEGLLMGTRSGDIDAGAVLFIARQEQLPLAALDSLLNRKSGMLGVSGLSNDVRTLIEAAAKGHRRATLALDMFAYRVKKYVGAYMAVLNGCDAIVFTGGIGENAAPLREKICRDLEFFGIRLDTGRNAEVFGREGMISAPLSKVALMVVPSNEEWEIARETAWIGRAVATTKHWVKDRP